MVLFASAWLSFARWCDCGARAAVTDCGVWYALYIVDFGCWLLGGFVGLGSVGTCCGLIADFGVICLNVCCLIGFVVRCFGWLLCYTSTWLVSSWVGFVVRVLVFA